MTFEEINDELDACLDACSIVKKKLRENCSFSVEMQYRLLINFIGMGEYSRCETLLSDLAHHPDSSINESAEIMLSLRRLRKCSANLDLLHDTDSRSGEKSTSRILEEVNIFAAKIGRFLEQ